MSENIAKTWEDKINLFKRSGMTQTKWCKENGIGLRTFNKWYKRFEKKSPESKKHDKKDVQTWIPVEIEKNLPETYLNVKVGKAVIEIKEGFNQKLLTDLIKVLEPIC